jgi:hypothetical protein
MGVGQPLTEPAFQLGCPVYSGPLLAHEYIEAYFHDCDKAAGPYTRAPYGYPAGSDHNSPGYLEQDHCGNLDDCYIAAVVAAAVAVAGIVVAVVDMPAAVLVSVGGWRTFDRYKGFG